MFSTAKLLFVLSTIAAILLVASVYLGIANAIGAHNTAVKTRAIANNNTEFSACISRWATKTNERSTILGKRSIDRQDTLDEVIRDFANVSKKTTPEEQAALTKKFLDHVESYIIASDRYKQATEEHPVPKSPKFACTNGKK